MDDDELARTLGDNLPWGGEPLRDVGCDGAIRAAEGETQTCTAYVGGRERRLAVTVSGVDRDQVDYAVREAS